MEDISKNESGEISRRDFLKDAGLAAGGVAIGSTVLLAACGATEYACPYDSEVFETKDALKDHIHKVHAYNNSIGNVRWPIPMCIMIFSADSLFHLSKLIFIWHYSSGITLAIITLTYS